MTILIIITFILLILNPQIVSTCVISSFKDWITILFPTLYINFILIDLLINTNALDYIAKILFPIFKYLFNIKSIDSAYIIILSIICGSPSIIKIIKNSIDNNTIDINEGNNLSIIFSSFSLPYIIMIASKFSFNILKFYILYLLSTIMLMYIFNNKSNKCINTKKNKLNLINTFINSTKKNMNIMIFILSIIMFFKVIIGVFNIPVFLTIFIEPLSSHLQLLALDINKKLKDFLITSSLSFLGISIHFQIISINSNINILKFILIKFLQSLFISFWFLI